MFRTCFLLFVLSLCCSEVTGQTYLTLRNAPGRIIKQYDEALELQKGGEKDKALRKFEDIVSGEPQFIDAHIALAELLYDLDQFESSAQSFERAITLDTFYAPRISYSLGRIYLQLGEFTSARKYLQWYLDKGNPGSEHAARTKSFLDRAKFSENLVAHPVQFEPKPIAGQVNTSAHEALPAFTADGQFLLFTRNDTQEDLYIAYWDSIHLAWINPEPMSAMNTSSNEGAHSVSGDGSTIAFTACGRNEGAGSCDLYFWMRENGNWLRPVNAGGLNSGGWDGQPALTPDGRGMYFSSDRPGGLGGRDLWYTERHGALWTKPVNLGAPVNTPGNEESPFLYYDSRTLYFMSDGHPGLGSYDLFVSTKSGSGWSQPSNLGYPINTAQKEGAFAIHPDRSHAYFTSDRGGQNDIYEFVLDSTMLPPPVSNLQGVVVTATEHTPLIADIVFFDLEDSTERYHYTTDDEGRFSTIVVHGRTYGIHVTAKDHVFWSSQIMYPIEESYGQKQLRIPLIAVEKAEAQSLAQPVVLKNIQFESGSATLLATSQPELSRLLLMLSEHPEMHIEVRGHTDNVGSDTDNQLLSESRAKAVYDWLVEKGISTSRLGYRGYGETRPVATNDTEEGRFENRRTEFIIRQDGSH